jgi:hypothetical protein
MAALIQLKRARKSIHITNLVAVIRWYRALTNSQSSFLKLDQYFRIKMPFIRILQKRDSFYGSATVNGVIGDNEDAYALALTHSLHPAITLFTQ